MEREVRFGNNRTCTSKTQQWSIPSLKRQRLHSPELLQVIDVKKPKPSKVLSLVTKPKCMSFAEKGTVEPLSEKDIDTLADITNGKCGLVALMRTEASQDNLFVPDFDNEVEVVTTDIVAVPKTIDQIKTNVGPCDFETFSKHIKITPAEQTLLIQKTKAQSSSETWHEHRNDRVTALIFKSAVIKVSKYNVIINPGKSKTLISNICGYNKRFTSKATDWGISNEPIARKNCIGERKKFHKEFVVSETGFHVDLRLPYLGATPDGLVNCRCHGPGVLEIKCPWTHRGSLIKDFVALKDSCLELFEETNRLKRSHSYYYQVQLQMYVTNRKYCDFYLCTTRDSFCERIQYDETFLMDAISKVKLVYEKLILPEIFTRKLRNSLTVEKDVTIVEDLINKVCDQEINHAIDFKIC